MQLLENQPLSERTSMKLGGPARYLVEALTKNDILKAVEWAKKRNIAIKVLGGGSNIVITDDGFDGLIIVNKIRGIVATETEDQSLILSCGAGEPWDEVVQYSVGLGLTGIEALSLIPGSTGATPVQNVGAYGQEVGDTILQVEAYDTTSHEFVVIDADDCNFGYRDSIFKSTEKDRYIITGVSFKLKQGQIEGPLYKGLQDHLDKHGVTEKTPAAIREAVITIRTRKLPDPSVIANTGSFFKNPVVSEEKFEAIKAKHPEVPGFHVHNGIKIPAGWLLEHSGFKDYDHGNGMATHRHHALVLVNRSATSYQALADIKQHLVSTVETNFGIHLEQEPETLK